MANHCYDKKMLGFTEAEKLTLSCPGQRGVIQNFKKFSKVGKIHCVCDKKEIRWDLIMKILELENT